MKKKDGLTSIVEKVAQDVKQTSYEEKSGDVESQPCKKTACQSTAWEKDILAKIFYREKVDLNKYRSGAPINRNFCPFPAENFLLEIQMLGNSAQALLRAVLLMLAYNYGGNGRVALSLNKLATLLKTDRRIIRSSLQTFMDMGLLARTDGQKEIGYGLTQYEVKAPTQCMPRKAPCETTGCESPPLSDNRGMSNDRVSNTTPKLCQTTGVPPVNQHPLSIKNQYIKNHNKSSSSFSSSSSSSKPGSTNHEEDEEEILKVWYEVLGLKEVTAQKQQADLHQLRTGLENLDRRKVRRSIQYLPQWQPFKDTRPRCIGWLIKCLPNLLAESERHYSAKQKVFAQERQKIDKRVKAEMRSKEINHIWETLDHVSKEKAIEEAKRDSRIRITDITAIRLAKNMVYSQAYGAG